MERNTPFAITFTEPVLATIGEAEEDGAVTGTADFSDQGRARVDGLNRGALTLYAAAPDGRLIGADLIAPAGEHLAHMLAWAVQGGLTATQLLNMPFYHPTVEEGLKQALRTICAATPIALPPEQDAGTPAARDGGTARIVSRHPLFRPFLFGMIGLAAAVGAACTPLHTFDLIVPKDAAGVRIASAVAYGEGQRHKLDIYSPRHVSANARLPIVIFFYGGSWASGSRTGYSFVGKALAAQGYIVVVPDYRIGPDNVYPDFVSDGADAVRWVLDHGQDYGGDTQKLVLSGHSAGAYIAAMLAVDARWLGTARRSIKGFVGIAGPYDFAPFDVPASQAAFGKWPRPRETQPVNWVEPGAPPTLLLIGGADETVKARNSETLVAKLKQVGVAAQLKRYPGIGHVGMVTAFARPFRYRAPVLDDSVRFIRSVTQGNDEPGRISLPP